MSQKDARETFIFNRKNFELFHFIAALNGHDLKKETMARVVVEYEISFRTEHTVHLPEIEREKIYLESQINLKLNTQEDINFAREQVLYSLWQKDLQIYNKQTEIRQMQEKFALWLKVQTDVFHSETRECEVYSTEAIKNEQKKFLEISIRTHKSFVEFESMITAELKNGTLMKNPAHLIHHAFALKKIYGSQRSHKSSVIPIFGNYPFLKEEPHSSNKDWWESAQEMGNYIVGQVSNLFSGGKIETAKVYIQNPMDKAINDLQMAIDEDDIYSWPAHNAMSFLRLIKDGQGIYREDQAHEAHSVKQQFVTDASNARNKLASFEIPRREGELAFLILNNMTKIGSPVALDYLWQIKVLNHILKQIENNIKTTTTASAIQMIYVTNIVQLRELKKITATAEIEGKEFAAKLNISDPNDALWQSSINSTETPLPIKLDKDPMIQELLSSGVLLHALGVFDLEREEEDDDDWFGSFFTGLLGIGHILAGLVMISTGGTFAPLFGSSLLMQGLGDVMTSLESIATDQSIDLDIYLKGKVIGLAINLLTTSIATITGIAPSTAPIQVGFNYFEKAATTVVMLRAFSKVLESAGDNLIKSNDGEIKARIKEAVQEFMSLHKEELETICAAAAYKIGTSTCDANTYNEIIARAYEFLSKHQKKFHWTAPTIVKGAVSGLLGTAFGGKPFSTAGFGAKAGIDGALSLIEGITLTDSVLNSLDGIVKNMYDISLNAKQMMHLSIKGAYVSDADAIIDILEAGNVFASDTTSDPTSINAASAYLCCECINRTKLETFETRRSAITSLCNNIGALFTSSTSDSARDALTHSLNEALLNRMHGVIYEGFTAPVANWASSGIAQTITEHIAKKAENTKQQLAADKAGKRKAQIEKDFDVHFQDLKKALQQKKVCEWQNPYEVEIESVHQNKSYKGIDKQQKKALDAYENRQYSARKEAKEASRKIDQEVREGKLSKQQAKIEKENTLEHYKYILERNRESLAFHHPGLSGLANKAHKISLQSIYGSLSAKIDEKINKAAYVKQPKQTKLEQADIQQHKNKQRGEYKITYIYDNYKSKSGHFYVKYMAPNEEEKLYGLNPAHKMFPLDKGFIKDEGDRYEMAQANKHTTVIEKTVVLDKESYEKSLLRAQELQSNQKLLYAAHFKDCIDFAQDTFIATGSEGDFIDLFTVKELGKMGLAGISARNRYGAGDEYFTVHGVIKEVVANKYNVQINRLKETKFQICGLNKCEPAFVIEPKINNKSCK